MARSTIVPRSIVFLACASIAPTFYLCWPRLETVSGTMTSPDATHGHDSVLGSRFDPLSAGSIAGRVIWDGPLPVVPPIRVHGNSLASPVTAETKFRDNPNAPIVGPDHRGIRDAVVYLEGVDLACAKPLHREPPRIVQDRRTLFVEQDGVSSRVGFARTGDVVEMESREPIFHSLRATGAAYFSLTFAEPGIRRRQLSTPGLVEWISAANYYWMRAFVFVGDHPYYARTDERGRFHFEGVPPGIYKLRCWHPNWKREWVEYDHQSMLVNRMHFAAPAELTHRVTVRSGELRAEELHLSFANFPLPVPRE